MPEGSSERAISARTAGVVRALGWICNMGYPRPVQERQALKAVGILYNGQPDRVPTMLRDQTTKRHGTRPLQHSGKQRLSGGLKVCLVQQRNHRGDEAGISHGGAGWQGARSNLLQQSSTLSGHTHQSHGGEDDGKGAALLRGGHGDQASARGAASARTSPT